MTNDIEFMPNLLIEVNKKGMTSEYNYAHDVHVVRYKEPRDNTVFVLKASCPRQNSHVLSVHKSLGGAFKARSCFNAKRKFIITEGILND